MATRVHVVAPATAGRATYRFWLVASVFHLALITVILAGTLLVPYLLGERPSTIGELFSFVLVVILLVPYVWFTVFAARTLGKLPPHPTPLLGGLPLRILRRINTVGFLLDLALLVLAGLYLAQTPLPRIAIIAIFSLLVVLAFALPPAVFIAKIHLSRIGQTMAGRLQDLRRLREELRRQHDPPRRA